MRWRAYVAAFAVASGADRSIVRFNRSISVAGSLKLHSLGLHLRSSLTSSSLMVSAWTSATVAGSLKRCTCVRIGERNARGKSRCASMKNERETLIRTTAKTATSWLSPVRRILATASPRARLVVSAGVRTTVRARNSSTGCWPLWAVAPRVKTTVVAASTIDLGVRAWRNRMIALGIGG